MCMVSMIQDYGRQNIQPQQWTTSTWPDFLDILKRLDALDKKLDQRECRDPEKAKWMKEVEAQLAALKQPKRKARKGKKAAKQ